MAMLGTGLILGGLSALGFGGTYLRLPKKVKAYVKSYPLVTDVLATAATYKVLGMTLTALIAAGSMSCLISIMLFFPKMKAAAMRQLIKLKGIKIFKRSKNKEQAMKNMIFPKLITYQPKET